MDVQKLELLLKKINQAIKTIQQLKEKEKQLKLQIDELSGENALLKSENAQLKNDIQKNNIIHNELESKITEILKYLPEDEDPSEDEIKGVMKPVMSKTISFDDDEITSGDGLEKTFINEDVKTGKTPIGYEKDPEDLQNKVPAIETEEEMLKKFVQEQQDIGSAFNMEAKNFPEITTNPVETASSFPSNNAAADNGVQIKGDTFINEDLFDNDAEEIEFNFEDKQNDDLPKGVL